MADFAWSPGFLNKVKSTEGFTDKPVWDFKQYSWGHGTRWQPGMPAHITPDQADADLISELSKARSSISQRWPNLPQNVAEGLSSFTYNLGPKWIEGGNLASAVDAGDWQKAAQTMQSYNHAGGSVSDGLTKRRQWEGQMLLGATPSMEGAPVQTVVKFGGDANTRGPRTSGVPAPLNTDALTQSNTLSVGMNRSKIMADMLNKMAYGGDAPKSNLEGLSRVVAAVGGAYEGSKQDENDLKKRDLLVQMLGGQSMTPIAQYAMASGDPDLQKAVVASEFQKRSDMDAKTLQLNDLINSGVPEFVAHGIVGGYLKQAQDGSWTDLRSGTRVSPDGKVVQAINPNYYQGQQPQQNVNPPPGEMGPPASAMQTVGGQAQPGAINPYGGDMALPKEATTEIEKQMADSTKMMASLDDASRTINPWYQRATGQAATSIENAANWLGLHPGLADPIQAQSQKMQLEQLFNDYRKFITGAAASDQELVRLQQAFPNTNMSPEQLFAAIETVHTINKRNYAINRDLIQRGLQPGTGAYKSAFKAAAEQGVNWGEGTDMAGVHDRSIKLLQEAEQRFQQPQGGQQPAAGNQPTVPFPAAGAPQAGQQQASAPPEAIAELKSNPTPQMRAHFDEVFGPGAAAAALGGQ